MVYKLTSCKNLQDFGEKAARIFIQSLENIENPKVILPTGNTPLPMYEALRESLPRQSFSYIQLDEYAGLEETDPRLFKNWLSREILDPLHIPQDNRITFQSSPKSPDGNISMIRNYLEKHGPADIAVLGIGENGHIGFNEPPSNRDSKTRTVNLADKTIEANLKYWNTDKIPEKAYTLGMSEILASKQIFLLATGAKKASILKQALHGQITESNPASYLQSHENLTVVADSDSLSLL